MSSERNNYLIGLHMIFFLIIYLFLKEILQLLFSRGFLTKLVWNAGIFKNTEVNILLRKQMEFQNILKIDFFSEVKR